MVARSYFDQKDQKKKQARTVMSYDIFHPMVLQSIEYRLKENIGNHGGIELFCPLIEIDPVYPIHISDAKYLLNISFLLIQLTKRDFLFESTV